MEYASYTVQDNCITLYRLYGTGPVVEVPQLIDGLPVTSLADHLFAGEMSVLCKPQQLLLARMAGDSWIRIQRMERGGDLEEDALRGDKVSEIHIPEGVKQIGSYAFYGLYQLREVRFPSTMEKIGWGLFSSCRKVSRLVFDLRNMRKMEPEPIPDTSVLLKDYSFDTSELPEDYSSDASALQTDYSSAIAGRKGTAETEHLSEEQMTPSILKEILDSVPNELEVVVRRGEGELYRLRFPAFYEEGKENTPARIIEIIYHGTGHQYRNCFLNRVLQFDKYDEVFPLAAAQETPVTDVHLILNRLRSGPSPKEEILRRYLEYLRTEYKVMMEEILDDPDFDPEDTLMILDEREYFTSTLLDESIQIASGRGDTRAVSCLMEIRSRRFGAGDGRRKGRYEL